LLTERFKIHFPDHTKFVLSPTGTHISATCISPEAASYLAANASLLPHHVSSREVFTDSLTSLLNEGGRVRARIVKANVVKEKLGYLLDVVDQWIGNGGLGQLDEVDEISRAKLLLWEGLGMDKQSRKVDCVSVGRYGGDLVAS
jgi:hypothetical protein